MLHLTALEDRCSADGPRGLPNGIIGHISYDQRDDGVFGFVSQVSTVRPLTDRATLAVSISLSDDLTWT